MYDVHVRVRKLALLKNENMLIVGDESGMISVFHIMTSSLLASYVVASSVGTFCNVSRLAHHRTCTTGISHHRRVVRKWKNSHTTSQQGGAIR